MLRHCTIEELLELRDGEGSAAARSHMNSCEACRTELDRLHQRVAALKSLPSFAAPRDRWPIVRDAMTVVGAGAVGQDQHLGRVRVLVQVGRHIGVDRDQPVVAAVGGLKDAPIRGGVKDVRVGGRHDQVMNAPAIRAVTEPDLVRGNGHIIGYLGNFHPCSFLDKLRKDADMGGVEMGDQNKGDTGIRKHGFEKTFKGLQPACGCPDADDRKLG